MRKEYLLTSGNEVSSLKLRYKDDGYVPENADPDTSMILLLVK